MNKKTGLAVVWLCVLGGLLFAITHFGPGGGPETPPPDSTTPAVSLKALAARWPDIAAHAAAPPRGPAAAPYTLVEFGDFQCPQCGLVRPMLERLLAKYPQQINLVFVHRPFPFYSDGSVMHKWAIPSAEAAQAAATFGKFWPMYDMLYSHQDDLEPGFYPDYAARLGIDRQQFKTAMAMPAVQEKVTASQKFTEAIHITSTPTVLVRDNATGKLWAYAGNEGTQRQPGVTALVAHPPWVK